MDRLLIVRVRVIVIVIAVVLGIVLQEPPGCSQPASKHQVCKHRCLWTITITVTIAITITITISIDAAVAVAVAIDIDIALTATVVGMIVFIITRNLVTITSWGAGAIRATTELQFPIVLISLLLLLL